MTFLSPTQPLLSSSAYSCYKNNVPILNSFLDSPSCSSSTHSDPGFDDLPEHTLSASMSPSTLHSEQVWPSVPFIRGQSQPFPPPVGRSYPKYPFPGQRRVPQSTTIAAQPTSLIQQDGARSPFLLHQSISPNSENGKVYIDHRCDLVQLNFQVENEKKMYFDVASWGWLPTQSDFQLETPIKDNLSKKSDKSKLKGFGIVFDLKGQDQNDQGQHSDLKGRILNLLYE